MKKTFIALNFFLFFSFSASAQYFTHDIGVLVGATVFQTDYVGGNNFNNGIKNSGVSVAIVHYLGFYRKDFLIKSEINFISKTNLEHTGEWALGTSELAQKLRAMRGSISMVNLGISLEYYLKFLDEYFFPYNLGELNPFFTFGIGYSFYKNDIVSDLGDWRQDITVLPQKYRVPGALAVGKGGAFALSIGVGTRYRLTEKLDLTTQLNGQLYFTDAIDGLQANVIENRNNERFLSFQFGIVYHLN